MLSLLITDLQISKLNASVAVDCFQRKKSNIQTFTLLRVCSVARLQGEQYCQNNEVIHHLSTFSCIRLTSKENIFIYLFLSGETQHDKQ